VRVRISALGALAILLVVAAVAATEVVTTVRVFQLRPGRLTIHEASAAVQPLLSESGTLTVQPHQRQLIVQDRPEVVAKVTALLEELQKAPDRYRIQVELLEASNAPLPPEQRATVDARVSRMFHFTSFRRIGATVFEGEIGQSAVAQVGEGYRVGFVTNNLPSTDDAPWGVAELAARFHLDRLTLVRTTAGAGGVQKQTEVLRTSVVLAPRQRTIFGASASEGSDRALVLILEALPAGTP
jgi:hypothetical protein